MRSTVVGVAGGVQDVVPGQARTQQRYDIKGLVPRQEELAGAGAGVRVARTRVATGVRAPEDAVGAVVVAAVEDSAAIVRDALEGARRTRLTPAAVADV